MGQRVSKPLRVRTVKNEFPIPFNIRGTRLSILKVSEKLPRANSAPFNIKCAGFSIPEVSEKLPQHPLLIGAGKEREGGEKPHIPETLCASVGTKAN